MFWGLKNAGDGFRESSCSYNPDGQVLEKAQELKKGRDLFGVCFVSRGGTLRAGVQRLVGRIRERAKQEGRVTGRIGKKGTRAEQQKYV